MKTGISILKVSVFLVTIFCIACSDSAANEPKDLLNLEIRSIYWSDGDSGRINGNIKFRLANIDAPETGGVGAIGGAKCELEREKGFEAKAYMVEATRDVSKLKIKAEYGMDKYNRTVLDLAFAESDLAQMAVDAGYLERWPHTKRRALKKKPDWC